jgi:hypothetical protein
MVAPDQDAWPPQATHIAGAGDILPPRYVAREGM